MATSPILMHVLDRNDYSKHHLVKVPAEPLPTLAPSSIRYRSKILGLTTNNFSYARLGGMLGWYDVHPLPKNAPAPYNDPEAYARISAWGYAEIIASTVPEVPAGQTMWGYLPISSGTVDVRIDFYEHNGQKVKDLIVVQDEYRQKVWKIYNRFWIRGPLSELEKKQGFDSLAWDTVLPQFFTSYTLSTVGFAWEDHKRIHPSGDGSWAAADADLYGATLVILNASSKTALTWAYALRHNRPKEHQPATLIGVGSTASVSMIQKTGFYDHVALNTDFETTASSIAQSGVKRVLLFDFGAREGANTAWNAALRATSVPVTRVNVGGEVAVQNPERMAKTMALLSNNDPSTFQSNACLTHDKALEVDGMKYIHDLYEAFDGFKKAAEGIGMGIQSGEGVEEWEKGWQSLLDDQVRADRLLVYRV